MKLVKSFRKLDMNDFGTFNALYIVRDRLYKLKIRLENFGGSSTSHPHSYIRDVDSNCLVWDNIEALENVKSTYDGGRTKEETDLLLDKEIAVMEEILQKME